MRRAIHDAAVRSWYAETHALELLFQQEYDALIEMGVNPDSEDDDWFGGFGY